MTVYDASEELQLQAMAGPHAGWGTFDIKLEGARFQQLQVLVSSAPFDTEKAEAVLAELDALAESSGYGTMDSYIADAAGETPSPEQDAILEAMHHSLHQGIGDSEYFGQVAKSVEILAGSAATPEAREFAARIDDRMTAAFIAGRDNRAAMQPAPAP